MNEYDNQGFSSLFDLITELEMYSAKLLIQDEPDTRLMTANELAAARELLRQVDLILPEKLKEEYAKAFLDSPFVLRSDDSPLKASTLLAGVRPCLVGYLQHTPSQETDGQLFH